MTTRDILYNLIGKETISKASGTAAKGLKGLGDQFDDTAIAAKKLDKQIADHQQTLRGLATQYAKTGNNDFVKQIREQEREIRKLTKVSKLLGNDDEGNKQAIKFGARLAENIASGLSTAGGAITRVLGNVFGTLPPQAQVGIGAAVVAAAASVAPMLGGVISGAVVGGIGIGGVIGGFAIAARNSQVKAAAQLTGSVFSKTLEQAGSSFVPVTLDALKTVRGAIGGLSGDLQRIFSKAAVYVKPLTDGVVGFVRNLLPGIESAIGKARPVINELASWGPKLGKLLSDVFSKFAANSYEASRALAAFWTVMQWGIKTTVNVIVALTEIYGWMEKLGLLLSGQVTKLAAVSAAESASKQTGDELSESLRGTMQAFEGVAVSADQAKASTQAYISSLYEGTNANISAEQSLIQLEASIDNATEALKTNGKTLDTNTPKGRANKEALLAIATAANTASEAVYRQTNSQESASAAAERGRQKFIATAVAMGMERGEAVRLANSLIAIPNITRTVDVKTQKALDAIRAVQAGLGKVNSKNITIGVYYKSNGDLKVPGGTLTKERWGGVYEKAATGLLNEAQTYSATNPGRYMIAEPETGGEAFIPKNGNAKRSTAILQKAASWYGLSVGRLGDETIGRPVAAVPQEIVVRNVINLDGRRIYEYTDRTVIEAERRQATRNKVGRR